MYFSSVVHGRRPSSKSTISRRKGYQRTEVLYICSSKSGRKSVIFSWRWGLCITMHPPLHFLLVSISFAEMPTQSYVESGFWCFDALFVPQQHPARDLQDTFYISDPPHSLPPEPEYYKRVSTVHEHGAYGSTGYRAPWSHEESSKLLLRTHTTASSAHMLYKLAAKCRGENVDGDDGDYTGTKTTADGGDGFKPAKLFSIDRVFRNETMDATHLAEFHQVEGVVADRNVTLSDLIGEFVTVKFNSISYTAIAQASCESSSRKWVLKKSGSSLRITLIPRFV